MALNAIRKISIRLIFLYRVNRFLFQLICRLLCNILIQSHFDYPYSLRYPYFNKSLKTKLQTLQYKCIRYCLNLNERAHVGLNEFQRINWLRINDRFEQCVRSRTLNFFNNKCPAYMNDVLKLTGHPNKPSPKTNYGQKILLYIAPTI